jgi:hypothetical protein
MRIFSLLGTLPTISATIAIQSMSSDLNLLSTNFHSLKDIKGHWAGGEYHSDADSFQGKKHKAMDQLLQVLGKPGTPASEIAKYMGEPDELKTEGVVLMPGPYMASDGGGNSNTNQGFTMIYHWRGNHDYIYFSIDSESQKVVQSGWYNALE